jgi:hypothetical protein
MARRHAQRRQETVVLQKSLMFFRTDFLENLCAKEGVMGCDVVKE